MSEPEQPYTAEYYRKHQEGARRSARAIVPLVLDLVHPRSMIDLGCGIGTWLSVFRELGVEDIQGVDGAHVDSGQLEIPGDRFQRFDLRQAYPVGRRVDLAVSLELAEHLPEDSGAGLVESLAALAPVVLFSAAAPHQGGAAHVNEQWPEYWAKLFARHGHRPIDCIRWRVLGDDRVEWWYQQNLLLFTHEASIRTVPALAAAHAQWGDRCPAIVHPTRFLEWVEWGCEESQKRW